MAQKRVPFEILRLSNLRYWPNLTSGKNPFVGQNRPPYLVFWSIYVSVYVKGLSAISILNVLQWMWEKPKFDQMQKIRLLIGSLNLHCLVGCISIFFWTHLENHWLRQGLPNYGLWVDWASRENLPHCELCGSFHHAATPFFKPISW